MSELKYCNCFFADSEESALADRNELSSTEFDYCQGHVAAGASFTLPKPMNAEERTAFKFVGPEFDNLDIWCYYLEEVK